MPSLLYFALLLSAGVFQAVTGHEVNDSILCFGNITVSLSKINYTLYNQQNQANGVTLNEDTFNKVDPNKRVILIIHGWRESGSDPWPLLMKDTYLNQTDANIITVDWKVYSQVDYVEAYCAVPQVGSLTGDLIRNLTITPGISLSNVQINGFSLGGQTAGFAGKRVQALTGSKIGRINGLDAAGEGYISVGPSQRLDPSDASFVQAIHTSNGQFGYPWDYGTVDFQVNYAISCGSIQNGCPAYPGIPGQEGIIIPAIACNHVRSVAYFIESITSDDFVAVPCYTCTGFGLGLCSSNSMTIMGENCPSTARGVHYLNTNYKPPLALGLTGVKGV